MRKRLVIVVMAVASLALIAVFSMTVAQPRYEGLTARNWILQLSSKHAYDLSDHTVLALQKLGPRAVPTAIKMIGVTNYSMTDSAYLLLLQQLPLRFKRTLSNKYYPISPEEARIDAVQALFLIGQEGRDAIPFLVRQLGAPHHEMMSYEAGHALGTMGPDAVQPVLDRLRENNPEVRRAVFYALGEIGQYAGDGTPALAAGLRDPDPMTRLTAEQALDKIGLEANPVLVEMLRSHDPQDREIAARVLATCQELNEDAVPALIEAARDPVPAVRKQAIESLRRICPGAKPAIAAFTSALADNDPAVRLAATQALGRPSN